MLNKKNILLSIVYFTWLVDTICWAVVLPIYPPYFLGKDAPHFVHHFTHLEGSILLGLFLSAFFLGQFIGSPIMGEFADRFGRRKAFILATFFTFIGLVLSAYGMKNNMLFLLFIGRVTTGVFASVTTVALASISDLSENKIEKVKRFSFLSALTGAGFLLGSFVAGKVTDPNLNPLFSLNFPLWVSSLLGLVNFLLVIVGMKETAKPNKSIKFDFLSSIHNIKFALSTPKIKEIYFVYFLFIFAWVILIQFLPVYFVTKFGFTSSDIANVSLLMAFVWMIGAVYLNPLLFKYFKSIYVLEGCLVGFTLLSPLLVFPSSMLVVILIFSFCILFGAMAWPIFNGIISDASSDENQGKILGLSQSVQSFSMAISPIIGGFAFAIFEGLPFYVASLCAFLSLLIYFFLRKKKS